MPNDNDEYDSNSQELTALEEQQIREGFYDKGSVPFKYSELDGEQLDELDPERAAVAAVSETLQWFLGFLFHARGKGSAKKPATAYKRLLAFCYILRPELIEGQTLEELMKSEFGQSRNALSKWTAEICYMFGLEGANQKAFRSRLAYRLAQLSRFDDDERDTLPRNASELSEWMKSSTFSHGHKKRMPAGGAPIDRAEGDEHQSS